MRKLSNTVVLTSSGDEISSKEVLEGEHHVLLAQADLVNRDIALEFSSREAMYDFAKSLLREAVFGSSGQIEFYSLVSEGRQLVVNGARMAEGSSRIFVTYGSERKL